MINGRINISRIIGITCTGIVLGVLCGLTVSISSAINYDYLSQKLYNLSLFEIQYNITAYSITFVLILLLAYVCFRIVNKFSRSEFFILKNIDSKQVSSLNFFICLSVLCSLIYLFFVSDILHLLKLLALNSGLRSFIESPVTTFRILVVVFLLFSMLFLILLTFIFSKLNIIETIVGLITRLVDSKRIRYAGYTVFALLVLFNVSIWTYKGLNKPDMPNVVLITIDTLRADHLGSYGYKRDTSPNIDSLAEKGILFENAYSQSSWTYPSMASMHTSLYPTQLGVNRFENRINEKLLTIAEHMKNNFYDTQAVVSNIIVSRIFGFGQGFSEFEETFDGTANLVTSKMTTEKAIELIGQNKDDKFFLWVHYMDPHDHYINHDEFEYASPDYNGRVTSALGTKELNQMKETFNEKDITHIQNLYDEEISYTDKYIGQLIDSLSEYGIDDNTIIILTADHGEELMDKTRFGHGHTLSQEVIKVPLIIYDPRNHKLAGQRISQNVEVRYIAKTISDMTNLSSDIFEGYDLLELAGKENSDSIVYSEIGKSQNAIFISGWKLISVTQNNSRELYNIEEDPEEKINQYSSDKQDVAQVKSILESRLADYNQFKQEKTNKLVLSKEDIDKLRALGYIQ